MAQEMWIQDFAVRVPPFTNQLLIFTIAAARVPEPRGSGYIVATGC
jgi:hypothetical protein